MKRYLYCEREKGLLENAQSYCLDCMWIKYLIKREVIELAVVSVNLHKKLKVYDARRCSLIREKKGRYV